MGGGEEEEEGMRCEREGWDGEGKIGWVGVWSWWICFYNIIHPPRIRGSKCGSCSLSLLS